MLKRPFQFLLALLVLIGFCQSVWAEDSLDAKGWFEKGNELSRAGKFAEAAEAYLQSTQLNNESPVAYYNLGISFKKIQQFDQALIAFEKTVALEPTHLDGWPKSAERPSGNVNGFFRRALGGQYAGY